MGWVRNRLATDRFDAFVDLWVKSFAWLEETATDDDLLLPHFRLSLFVGGNITRTSFIDHELLLSPVNIGKCCTAAWKARRPHCITVAYCLSPLSGSSLGMNVHEFRQESIWQVTSFFPVHLWNLGSQVNQFLPSFAYCPNVRTCRWKSWPPLLHRCHANPTFKLRQGILV